MKKIPQLPILKLVHLLWICPASLQADPLDEWTWRNPLPQGNGLSAVAYGNNQFVAVGYLGTILTSPDGIAWTERPSAAPTDLFGITFGNNQFVAVGYKPEWNPTIGEWQAYGTILTSADGINWTNRALVSSNALYGIAYANDQFVVVGERWKHQWEPDYGAILTSPDGNTWTSRDAGTTNSLHGIASGANLFVAVGHTGTIVTSPDGITWTSRNSGTTDSLTSIAYGNTQFVAVKDGHHGAFDVNVLTSPDGITWTRQEGWWGGEAVAFGNDVFVAVGGGGYGGDFADTIQTSPDGISWTWTWNYSFGGSFWLEGVVYGKNKFVAVGDAGTILTSPDGGAWTKRTATTTGKTLLGIVYGDGQFVGVGYAGTIVTSPDGITWTNIPAPLRTNTSQSWYWGIAYGNNKFVAVGGSQDAQDPAQSYDAILTSSDGLIWIDRNSGTTNQLASVAYGNNWFVAVGKAGTILTSPDGITWTSRPSGATNWLSGIAYGNNQFVAVGGGVPSPNSYATILTSPDGINWTRRAAGLSAAALLGIAYGDNTFVAVGYSDTKVLTSPDGVTWTGRASGTDGQLNGIAYGINTFVAVGDGAIVTSPDGLSWTSHAFAGSDLLWAVAYGNKTFVAVGDSGKILQSGVVASMQPVLGPVRLLPDGEVRVTLMGLAGQTYSVQASTNLSQWTDLTKVVLTNSFSQFFDHFATNFPQRFYRAAQQ
jgi:hypothetical protein